MRTAIQTHPNTQISSTVTNVEENWEFTASLEHNQHIGYPCHFKGDSILQRISLLHHIEKLKQENK